VVPVLDPEVARRIERDLGPRVERARELREAASAAEGRRSVRPAGRRLVGLLALRRPAPAPSIASTVRRLPQPLADADPDTDARRSA
jgi:hypothetical protein